MRYTMGWGALAVSALFLGAARQGTAARELVPLLARPQLLSIAAPDAPEPALEPPRASVAMRASSAEREILARIVKGECWPDTPFEGKVAVAAVVLNRVRSQRFPMSIRGVAHQRKQFSCYNRSNRRRLYRGPIPPDAWKAARAALAGQDPTRGCLYFFNPNLVRPRWARKLERVTRISTQRHNTHDFYRPKP